MSNRMQCNVMEPPSGLLKVRKRRGAPRTQDRSPLLVQPERTPSVSVRPLAAERRFRSMAHQAEAGRQGLADSRRRLNAATHHRGGGAVAHHARLAARLERRVLPIHLAILGALAAKLLEVASEMTAAVRRRTRRREKNKRIRCRASHPWLRSDSPPSSLLPDDLTMIS